jgi:hypothetical protein
VTMGDYSCAFPPSPKKKSGINFGTGIQDDIVSSAAIGGIPVEASYLQHLSCWSKGGNPVFSTLARRGYFEEFLEGL